MRDEEGSLFQVVGEAVKLAEKIAAQSPLTVCMAKEAVNKAFETTLREGLQYERRLFHATFATVHPPFLLSFLPKFQTCFAFRKTRKKE